jgi:CheY-like chemotaxis protein
MKCELVRILMAEDDPEDQLLVRKAFQMARVVNDMDIVNDGLELLQYLRQEGKYVDAHRPDLILLDLNMPRMDGREMLVELKNDPDLRRIPVVILTTSQAEQDILQAYDLQASCYISKPVNFDEFHKVIRSIEDFWLAVVKLPSVVGIQATAP